MPPPSDKKFFFIHVMKTGGTSFVDIIAANFAAGERFPDASAAPDTDIFRKMEAYLFVPGMVESVNAMDGRVRIVLGHVPYAVRSLLHDSYVGLTLLRNPIDRTVSYLKHCRRYHAEHRELALEKIYEDPWFYETFMHNYQTKIFSMSAHEALVEDRLVSGSVRLPPRRELIDEKTLSAEVRLFERQSPGRFALECFAASTGVITVDEQRLAIAKRNLAVVEVVGVTEHYDRFLQQLVDRYSWTIHSIPHRHAGEHDEISPEFRQRIARDNAFDMELYEYARSLAT